MRRAAEKKVTVKTESHQQLGSRLGEIMRLFAVLFVLCFFWWTAKANEESFDVPVPSEYDAKQTHFLCQIYGTVRTIRIVQDGEECNTTYTKEGQAEVVAEGRNKITCYSVLHNIKNNLEKAKWKCRDISSAVVLESNNESQ